MCHAATLAIAFATSNISSTADTVSPSDHAVEALVQLTSRSAAKAAAAIVVNLLQQAALRVDNERLASVPGGEPASCVESQNLRGSLWFCCQSALLQSGV